MIGAPDPLFGSMIIGGFECAAQKLACGRRLDVSAATGHVERALEDYRLLVRHGMRGARDGLRWHVIERQTGCYDWTSVRPLINAARTTNVSTIWDLLHYGVPDDVDLFKPSFITRFARFCREAARFIRNETDQALNFTPINEISYWAWAGGDQGSLNPFMRRRGGTLKRQLVSAFLAAADEIRDIDPSARICASEPLIHIRPPDNASKAQVAKAAAHTDAQYDSFDMLLGRRDQTLGGHERALDVLGVNYYYNNQWIDEGKTVHLGDWRYVPLRALLLNVQQRYPRHRCYISETGTEGVFRPYWLRYVADELIAARKLGASFDGLCVYPILSHLGWDDNRRCENGLFEAHDSKSVRHVYQPLADEIAHYQNRLENFSGDVFCSSWRRC